MEIPNRLKTLYKHWEKHTKYHSFSPQLQLPTELEWFIRERMLIWELKFSGGRPPYTSDPILQKYKFCNIYRELDRQTIQIHTSLKKNINNFSLWLLNLAFYRFVCKPETVSKVGPLSYDKEQNNRVYEKLLQLSRPKYGTACIFPISTIQSSNYHTREQFFCFYLPRIIPKIALEIEKFENITINQALKVILPIFGFNLKFHWTEILIDVAYQFPKKVNLFKNFYVGPGAIPTAKVLSPREIPTNTVDLCVGTELEDFPYLTFNNKSVKLSAENWEGIFCEYRKYVNLKQGRGRIRKFLQ